MDLDQIEIVLTDFGMADPDSKGGTPIFASPECFETKDKKSDVFSFGRVILFVLLSKKLFLKCLFVPIKNEIYNQTNATVNLVSQMTSLYNRISLDSARSLFDQLRQKSQFKFDKDVITKFETIIENEISSDYNVYVDELCDFR